MEKILFFDTEVDPETSIILDIGAIGSDGNRIHSKSVSDFLSAAIHYRFFCGHNIIPHDLKYIGAALQTACVGYVAIDTLSLSPLLFPAVPYHHLVKDDKLQNDELNNPLSDAIRAKDLFYDELAAYEKLPLPIKSIFRSLLGDQQLFSGFFAYLSDNAIGTRGASLTSLILQTYKGKICTSADLTGLIDQHPVELAYALALINTNDKYSITPPWLVRNYPYINTVMRLLRNTPCSDPYCIYCRENLNARKKLKKIFGFDDFRRYDGEPLQERAAEAAVQGKSLLAVFPTGGGKSVTFQLPALIAGEASRGLTVVISPLQSLMKDQVDGLEKQGIIDAVTINGLLDPIERKEAIDRVICGKASILYISPESLRSKTIERMLLSRNVVRFVIDEAHCFSAWGQDFRVDYMYIGNFIKSLQEQKGPGCRIAVSCFTATAKQKVISDIMDYFREKLGLELELYATQAARTNLRYAVMFKDDDDAKYAEMRRIIQEKNCPTIVYVSRVKRTKELALRLTRDGFSAAPYNGKMDSADKIRIQDDFIQGSTQIIVATSAFGMGVDKKDVRLVVHYNISASLEDYVQEAGRAGRDPAIDADCYVLFNDDDLNRHFILLNQTKLTMSEIQQIWKAIKELTKQRDVLHCSALELARMAGWDDSIVDIETRVKTAVAALENAGYIERGFNIPHVYADSITVHDMGAATVLIERSSRMGDAQKEEARRIMSFLISRRNTSKNVSDEAESRIDYIADRLGLRREAVVDSVLLMREEGLLADHMDLSAFIGQEDTQNRAELNLKKFLRLESFLIDNLPEEEYVNYKALNDCAIKAGINNSTVKDIRTIIFFWMISGWLKKELNADEEHTHLTRTVSVTEQRRLFDQRSDLSEFIIGYLFDKRNALGKTADKALVNFSVKELQKAFNERPQLLPNAFIAGSSDVQNALLFLSKIRAVRLEGGFLVVYNALQIKRLELDNHIKYKQDDYKTLDEFYTQKMQQIHIVGEYAHLMVKDYNDALLFVKDYFGMDYKGFLSKYFKGTRAGEINRNITPAKYQQIFGELSPAQLNIINDDSSKYIVVSAGPGSGKTRVLVHKLAALDMLEDIKHEQLLMLTFSRSAATEFKMRLLGLIGNAAHFIEIKTFHSYCFDLLGKIGSLDDAENVVQTATQMIEQGEVEPGRITKSVLVLDEAQDMDGNEFALVQALIKNNEDMRVIAVGDDDQNIYEFRGSDSKYMKSLISDYGAVRYDLLDNYRSDKRIVSLANSYVNLLNERLKTEPLAAVPDEDGIVVITKHACRAMEVPLVRQLIYNKNRGRCGVLTGTNDEALRIVGLLKRNNVPARLIQSNDQFDLYNLAEFRHFLKLLNNDGSNPVIDEQSWNSARMKLVNNYENSLNLPLCARLLNTFEKTNRTKYINDFVEYLHESKLEDFENASEKYVLVSTIHKAKGREFDSVYLQLTDFQIGSEEKKRVLYVGITRAKSALYIHTNGAVFDDLKVNGIVRETDNEQYEEPDEITLQLSHKDVYLDFFKGKEKIIAGLRSGNELIINGNYLMMPDNNTKLLRFSQAFKERIDQLSAKGYAPNKASVRFIVAWKGENDERETAIILPDIVFKRQ